MRFWDSSALVAVLVEEPAFTNVAHLLGDDRQVVVWWATEVECVSALEGRRRGGVSSDDQLAEIMQRLAALRDLWREMQPTAAVRREAQRLLRRHPLRAADALQLAAAHEFSATRPNQRDFVTLDTRLGRAATAEGFSVLPVPAPQATAGEPS